MPLDGVDDTAVALLTDYALKNDWQVKLVGEYLYFVRPSSKDPSISDYIFERSASAQFSNRHHVSTSSTKQIYHLERALYWLSKGLLQDGSQSLAKKALQAAVSQPLLIYSKFLTLQPKKFKETLTVAVDTYSLLKDHSKKIAGGLDKTALLRNAVEKTHFDLLAWYLRFNPHDDPRSTSKAKAATYFLNLRSFFLTRSWERLASIRDISRRLNSLAKGWAEVRRRLLEGAQGGEGLGQAKAEARVELEAAINRLWRFREAKKKNVGRQYAEGLMKSRLEELTKEKEQLRKLIEEKQRENGSTNKEKAVRIVEN